MGDRANIYVSDSYVKGGVYLYSHWDGDGLRTILKTSLAKKWRWDDCAYLTRIIFCEMVKSDINGETGYGISLGLCDNEYPILIVDCEKQIVGEMAEDDLPDSGKNYNHKKLTNIKTFDEYIRE